ncbi:MAG: uracil-DNA glycosylase [Holosporales bacterium]|jgi:DNA polymerase|nr:uracil-DNA glycosylase [Holosporales bacterium]
MQNDKKRSFIEWSLFCGVEHVLSSTPQNLTGESVSVSCATISKTQEMQAPLLHHASSLDSIASFADLREALMAFDGSPLKKTATNLVFGEGNSKAQVMFVGEAPGADEDRLGRPFVGVSGQLLDKMLAVIGLDRTHVYITNILPWRPPGNRTPTTEEMTLFLPFVRKHIALVSPRILCLVGGTAVKALLSRQEGIMRLRGRWFEYEGGISILPTYHPAFLLRSPSRKKESWQDFLAIHKKLQNLT